jgi:hypothetical protein
MKKIILFLFLILGKYGVTADKPYEATWLQLTKIDNGYVIYNYPILDNEKLKTMIIHRVEGDSLIFIDYKEIDTFKFRNVEHLNENSYSMLDFNDSVRVCGVVCTTFIRFDYVNKDKHIAKWKLSQCGSGGSTIIENTFIDSSYNTFPIIDYNWERSGKK